MFSTIFEGPVTTSTFVITSLFSMDFGIFETLFSFLLSTDDMTVTALDKGAAAIGLLVLSVPERLLGFMASGFTLVTVGGGGFVSITFSCIGFSVFGGSGKI